ncbi:unnamed protein product [Mytilus coruscus]|uniref:Peptidase M14 domain-containing protein n=1 Tax=Mytilus coruscus TaxID=42192 RepID=A0A6J8CN35_MYTCO|nr:unnamed protein product [Mytilus coruscus]
MKGFLVLSIMIVEAVSHYRYSKWKSQDVPECMSPSLIKQIEENPAIKENIIKRHQGLSNSAKINFKKYNRYPVIEKFLKSLCNRPTIGTSGKKIFAYEEEIGTTVENRKIHLVKIFKKEMHKKWRGSKRGRKMKPAILIEGGIHAREWISPAVVLYLINQLKNNPQKDPAVEKLVDLYDWYIIPVLNPDGYVYTYTTDPCWRKNRRQTSSNPVCFGVDLNRNFGFDDKTWDPSVGGSTDPCSYGSYAGTGPFTEEESKAMMRVMRRNKRGVNFVAYFAFHSYSQIWSFPWGYTQDILEDAQDLRNAANVGAAAIFSKHNEIYRVNQSSFIPEFGLIAGASDDYARGGAKIKYSYTIELRDKGEKKFFLPASEITPTGEEIMEGIKAFANFIYLPRRKYSYYNYY